MKKVTVSNTEFLIKTKVFLFNGSLLLVLIYLNYYIIKYAVSLPLYLLKTLVDLIMFMMSL